MLQKRVSWFPSFGSYFPSPLDISNDPRGGYGYFLQLNNEVASSLSRLSIAILLKLEICKETIISCDNKGHFRGVEQWDHSNLLSGNINKQHPPSGILQFGGS